MERSEFLGFVKNYIEIDPEAAAHISDYVQEGLRRALSDALVRAADMEVIAAVALAKKGWPGGRGIIKNKLEQWHGKTSLNWDGFMADIKE